MSHSLVEKDLFTKWIIQNVIFMLFSNTKQEFIQKYVLSPNKHIFLKSLISSLLYVFHKTFIYCLGSTSFVYSHGYLYFRDSHWGIYVYACPILNTWIFQGSFGSFTLGYFTMFLLRTLTQGPCPMLLFIRTPIMVL